LGDNEPTNKEYSYGVATIVNVLNAAVGSPTGAHPWLLIQLHRLVDVDESFACFDTGTFQIVPLGWNGWSIAQQISLVAHPLRPATLLLNHRVQWVIADARGV
jgi:hypothetical protein